jgi:ABC-type uncharacterized transport system involved in gliding motility auxiliary subunit
MKEKKLDTLLYSTIGVIVMFIIVVAVNLIASALNSRVDLTENRVYTLSPGTKAILAKIDAPVEVSFYYSQSQTRMPAQFKTYAKRVEDLLAEFRQHSRGHLEIRKLDPQPDSEAEDSANLDGVEGQMIETGEKIYLGVAISQPPQKVALPFLAPNRERLLEYDLARALSQVISTNKPVVGVMTPLQVFGMSLPPQMRMQMGGQNQDPWVFLSELKRDFEVKQVQMDTDKIDDDIKVLLVIHPKEIKDAAQYAIDQFIMRGGKLIACLDPMSLSDVNRQNPMIPMPGGASNLEKLLKAWGITFETTKVLADMKSARQLVVRQGGQPEIVPTLLFLTGESISKDDVVANQIDEVLLPFAGGFTGTPASGLKQTVLLKTTKDSQLVEPFMAQMSPSKIVDDFKSADTTYALAIRLEGKFKTAFPDGRPEAPKSDDDKDKDEKKEEKKPEDKAKDTLKECKTDNAVLLVADTDWLSDQFSVAVQNFFGQKIIQPRNGNLALTQNIVEQFAGDQNLIGVRSRGTLNRPFTVVKEMQAQANARFQAEIAKLQKEADEANQKLSELQSKKEGNQRFFVSKEQQEEIEKFKKKRAEANKHLKLVRRSLAKDIESLELRTKVINIAGVPLLVAAAGIALAMVRKQKTKAQ